MLDELINDEFVPQCISIDVGQIDQLGFDLLEWKVGASSLTFLFHCINALVSHGAIKSWYWEVARTNISGSLETHRDCSSLSKAYRLSMISILL